MGKPPPVESWLSGIFEFSDFDANEGVKGPRRLILQGAMAAPGKNILAELYEPRLIDVRDIDSPPYLVFRGIERVRLDNGQAAAVIQEWLVTFDIQSRHRR